ncbi:MAG: hypothetical protein ABR513_03945 [Desulfotignum sp.]
MIQTVRTVLSVVVALMCVPGLTGCAKIFPGGQSAESQTAVTASVSEARPAAGARQTEAVYYDFEDVLIPVELSVVQDKTMIVSTPGFTSGILMLKGRVERRSLINFFNNNMLKDNWSMVSRIASPNMAILVFEKPTKSAVISIKSEQIFIYVEVGVAARVNQSALPDDGNGLSRSDLTQ